MLNETTHTFSGKPTFIKKQAMPSLWSAGIDQIKVKEVGEYKLEIYFDADNKTFESVRDLLQNNSSKKHEFEWR